MAMAALKGELVYKIYRALTYGLSPLLHLHLHWRKLRGLEHPLRWPERLGRPSLPRPSGPLLWFHAVSLGEGMAAIPVIKCCSQKRPDVNILMTTTTFSAFEVLKTRLPDNVIYQFAPLDTPPAMDAFLGHWKPNGIVIMESELWPNLIMGASKCGIGLALLNARLSPKSFRNWSRPVLFQLISLLLSKFSLIVPLSTLQAIHFQLLQASPFSIKFSGDLKYAVAEYEFLMKDFRHIDDLQKQLSQKHVWMAASIHRGEEEIMLGVHKVLLQTHPDIITIIVPRHPEHGQEIAEDLQKEGHSVALRSQHKKLIPGTSIYVVDTLGELRQLYKLTPIAVIGGSFLPGLAGHNISEAAAAGCAVLTGEIFASCILFVYLLLIVHFSWFYFVIISGHHVGHFSHMVIEMQQFNPLSVMQVSGKLELEKAVMELFSNAKILESRQKAAKEAFHALSRSVIANVWNLLKFHFLRIYVELSL
ncbi:hypothetical protein CCACVL1_12106 [Corchorus capsularis]|uniref:lipid IVA 3-deoxy-D-manno-octulosonic acid transferase n=1 Tax=Corchorus capsularis TaxID=210143 RepID=A0A1R3IHF3_COCAP|nr:hypothetical protein CCACVL1_12106 [Corchorus capsularis]